MLIWNEKQRKFAYKKGCLGGGIMIIGVYIILSQFLKVNLFFLRSKFSYSKLSVEQIHNFDISALQYPCDGSAVRLRIWVTLQIG